MFIKKSVSSLRQFSPALLAFFLALVVMPLANAQQDSNSTSEQNTDDIQTPIEQLRDAASGDKGTDSSSDKAAEDDNGSGEQSSFVDSLNLADVINTNEVMEEWEGRLDTLLDSFGIENSFRMKLVLSGIILALVLFIFFLLRYLVNRLNHFLLHRHFFSDYLSARRVGFIRFSFNAFVAVLMGFSLVYALAQIWLGGIDNLVFGDIIEAGLQTLAGVILTLCFAALVFEVISFFLERRFYVLVKRGNARTTTLLPILRNVIYGVLVFLLGITFLSEIGIDIMPLLAGAGVVGFAVGFGAQTFVKDLINGFVIILEDLIQVGDVATVGGKTGLVEKITLRKVQLRNLDGVVYTVPFSEITIVENLTKDFSYYLFNVGVAYRENPDEVIELLRGLGREMREDEDYADKILEDLDVLGVDKFADSAIVIKARLKTRPLEQWAVGREFNRRMKHLFDKHNIEIPFPHQTLYFGEDKEGSAPPAHVDLAK